MPDRPRPTAEDIERTDRAYIAIAELLGIDESGPMLLEPGRWVCLSPDVAERLLELAKKGAAA